MLTRASFTIKRRLALLSSAFVISSLAAFGLVPALASAQVPPPPVVAPAPGASSSVHPVNVFISGSDTNAAVIPVGVTSAGDLDVPHNFVQAGWYEDGPVPGQEGSAVIDGHVDNGGYAPTIDGIFKSLGDLKPGDTITVALSDGANKTFKVVSSAVYDYTDFPSDLVFNQTGAAYLKIITCHGTWLPDKDTYSQRLVVTAVLE